MNRTLVRSPPDLWPEFSEVERLANHLCDFGEITISRLEPTNRVAWEGERVCGTVELEAAGLGTKVTLKAMVREAQAEPVPTATPLSGHQVVPDLEAWDRSAAEIETMLGGRRPLPEPTLPEPPARPNRRAQVQPPEPQFPQPPAPETADPHQEVADGALAADEERTRAILQAALENLGAAHHRSFSRG